MAEDTETVGSFAGALLALAGGVTALLMLIFGLGIVLAAL